MKGNNWYRVDLRELAFVLFEQFRLGELLGKAPFDGWGEQECREVLKQTQRFTCEVLGPLNSSADREGCRLEDGGVKTPRGFKEAWAALYDTGFKTLAVPMEHGGQGAPGTLRVLVEEMLSGSNAAFAMYPGLTEGASELIDAFGTPAQRERYLGKMRSGQWAGTMCLTEPQAGSDVGAAQTRARRNPDGSYSIVGTKIFISAGDHDLAENVVHMVLARVEGAPVGTKGLSLFIVPKRRVLADGALGEPNDVAVAGIEHKLGINASATAMLSFGENGKCVGELVGTVEHAGMSQMFMMMNGARIAVGIQGVGIASTAYLNALNYARERKQGSSFKQWKDPTAPRVPILEHADVRRMLLEMKAKVEGMRAMVVKLAMHADRAAAGTAEEVQYHQGQVDLLTPLVKAYCSDQAFQVCTTAIQVYGGAGFLRDHPVEQYLRDSKIFSIYEGTNHIQAMDLVGRKLGQHGGANMMQFLGDVGAFVESNKEHSALGADVKALAKAQEAVASTAMAFMQWTQTGKTELLPTVANRFLEMMSELTVGWMLLDAAVLAHAALSKPGVSEPDGNFYKGKVAAAQHFARAVLPGVTSKAKQIAGEDRTPIDIPAESFATV